MEFAAQSNDAIYAEWHSPLLDRLFAPIIDMQLDLYRLTHEHRLEHNGGRHQGPCTAWPSPPYRAPIWHLLAQETGAKRFLEVGTGIGYTTALMAEAGGQDAKVDTIELDSTHADITESELERKALSGRVSVLRGDARKIVRTLAQPYDVVFADSGADSDIMPHLRRLTRSGGVSPHIKGLLRVPLIELLAELRATLERGTQDESLVIDRARDRYRQIVKTALETTWNQQAQS